jgi:organic radical activating enzyme
VGCKSCNVNAVPKGGEFLSAGVIDDIFKSSEELIPDFIIITGGEPFNSYEELIMILQKSKKMNRKSEVLSSGSWYGSHPELLKKLSMSSCSLRISLDIEHQQRVPFNLILELIESALLLDIEVNFTLRKAAGISADPEKYKLEILDKFPVLKKDLSRRFHVIPHFEIKPLVGGCTAEFIGKRWQKSCPQILKDLVIGWDGRIYPCCGIFQRKDYRLFGLELSEGLGFESIRRAFLKNRDLKVLYEDGPAGLLTSKISAQTRLQWGKIIQPCDLCFAIWYNERNSK